MDSYRVQEYQYGFYVIGQTNNFSPRIDYQNSDVHKGVSNDSKMNLPQSKTEFSKPTPGSKLLINTLTVGLESSFNNESSVLSTVSSIM